MFRKYTDHVICMKLDSYFNAKNSKCFQCISIDRIMSSCNFVVGDQNLHPVACALNLNHFYYKISLKSFLTATEAFSCSSKSLKDSKHWRVQWRRQGRPSPRVLNSFIFIWFSAKILQNNRLAHPLLELAHPQENPASATAKWIRPCKFGADYIWSFSFSKK